MAGAERLHLTVTVRSGAVRVTAQPGAELAVRKGQVEREGPDRYRVTAEHSAVEVVCPEGTDVSVANTSGRIEITGPVGHVRATSSSGRVVIETAASVDVRTTSGRVDVGTCQGPCTVRTTSSRIDVGRAPRADIATTSGRVTLGEVDEAVVQTVSGTVRLSTRTPVSRIDVLTQSAGVEIAVPEGSTPALALHSTGGKVRTDCRTGDDGRIAVQSTSGSIHVRCR